MDATKFFELLPGSQAVASLNDLRDKAMFSVKRIRDRRKNELFLEPFDFIRATNKQLFQDVTDADDIIGEIRSIRILRNGTTDISGVDQSVEEVTLDSAARFAACVAGNIGEELEEIDRRRMIWLAFLGTLLSATAALFAAISAGLQWWLRT